MGPTSSAMTTSGQKPPMPALMGRNRIPAPTAVPNRLITQVESCLLQPRDWIELVPCSCAAATSCAPVTVFDMCLTPNVCFLLSRRKDTVFLIKNVDQIHLCEG